MRILAIACITFLLNSTAYSCTCWGPDTFYKTTHSDGEKYTVKAIKLNDVNHGMDVKVIHSYHGQMPEDTIRVWGDTGILCRTYTDRFEIGDTIIMNLHLMDYYYAYYPEENIGDYILSSCGVHFLEVKDNNVIGVTGYIVSQTPVMEIGQFDELMMEGKLFDECIQTINLNAGWNLISFSYSPANNTVASVFDGLQPGNLEFITGFDNRAKVFDPALPSPFNTLQTIDDGFGYWVKVANADQLINQGGCIDDSFRKPIDEGWNLIAYPQFTPQSPSTYFADLIEDGNLEFVSGFNNNETITYDPTLPGLFNNLEQMENGFGYWIKVINE